MKYCFQNFETLNRGDILKAIAVIVDNFFKEETSVAAAERDKVARNVVVVENAAENFAIWRMYSLPCRGDVGGELGVGDVETRTQFGIAVGRVEA